MEEQQHSSLCVNARLFFWLLSPAEPVSLHARYTPDHAHGAGRGGGETEREQANVLQSPLHTPWHAPKDVAPGTEKRAGALRAQGVDSSMP